jgi:superfamily II DNA or RNA helicase
MEALATGGQEEVNALLAEIVPWAHQTYAVQELTRRLSAGERRICLTSPTGGGKSLVICMLIEWALENGWYAVLYTNRRLLVQQLSRVLKRRGIEFGVRAAGHEDRRHLPVQVSSLPTEHSRVLKRKQWEVHGHGQRVLAIVDEAHLNKEDTAVQILARHQEHGGAQVGFTATPIDLGHLYDSLVVAGTPSELRAAGCLVPAYHFGPDEPDMRGFKQSVKTGEFTEGDVRRAIMTKCILSRVIENYRRINPEGRPSILFGPGVPESQWFAERLTDAGIRAAHIDGEGVWLDGEYRRGTDREHVLQAVRDGDIKVLCNRFVLREGLDLPEVSHLIFATVMGSLQSWLQAGGRGLRACPGKDRCTVQDHGGHWWRHGSLNADRQWELGRTETVLAGMRAESFREKKESEPICCPECGLIRNSGSRCPRCGHESPRRSRKVIERDGSLREHEGDIYKPRKVQMRKDTAQLWERMYYRARRSRNRMNFNQAMGLFVAENYYWPPRDLPLMPRDPIDFYMPVADVPKERLNQ